jgi:type II secretory pathway pseudopilin PulG
MPIKIKSKFRGFSMVEMLIYIFLVTILTVVVVNSLIFMSKSFSGLNNEKMVAQSGNNFLNRFSYEVRQATGLSVINNSLTLTGGAVGPIVFATSTAGQLTLNNEVISFAGVTATKLQFKQLKNNVSQGVAVEITLVSGSGSSTRSQNFQLTTMLRNN